MTKVFHAAAENVRETVQKKIENDKKFESTQKTKELLNSLEDADLAKTNLLKTISHKFLPGI